ncbi:MAG: nitroreductase [Dehalococcoidia bacterium]|nr:nitroreductase [Dehalococcoidia bacterium]
MEYEAFLALAKKRRSIRRFKPDPLPEGSIEKILEVARLAMSGANGQPWEFVVVKDAVTKGQIGKIIDGRQQRHYDVELSRVPELRHPNLVSEEMVSTQVRTVSSAAAIIVVCGDPRAFQATVLGNQFFSGEQDIFHMNLANATMLIHLAVASLGLGSAWVTVDRPAEHQLKELLGIPIEFKIYVMVPVGHRHPEYEPLPSYRREVKEITHYERYDKSRYRTGKDILEWLAKLRTRDWKR